MFVFVSSSLHNHCSGGRPTSLSLTASLAYSLARSPARSGKFFPRYIRKRMENGKKTNSGCLGRMINFPERTRAPSFPGKLEAAYFIYALTRRVANLISSEFHYTFRLLGIPLIWRLRHRPSGIFNDVNFGCNHGLEMALKGSRGRFGTP